MNIASFPGKSMTQSTQKKKFILKGETIAYIDWANVHGWESSLRREIDIGHLFTYLKAYSEISDVRLYFGKDIHPKSEAFLERAEKAGYAITTKPVKYILEAEIEGKKSIGASVILTWRFALTCTKHCKKMSAHLYFLLETGILLRYMQS